MSDLKAVLEEFSGFLATEIIAAGVLKGDGRPDLKPELNNKPKGTLYKDNTLTDGAVLWVKTGNDRNWSVVSIVSDVNSTPEPDALLAKITEIKNTADGIRAELDAVSLEELKQKFEAAEARGRLISHS